MGLRVAPSIGVAHETECGCAGTRLMVRSGDGTPIACWRCGTGPSLVLVHGSTVDHTVWHSVLLRLKSYFTVYAIDRRGRGASGDSAAFSIEREVEDVAAVIESIGGAVHVMGHSYGALVALEATRLTQDIANLVLYDPPMISMGPDEIAPGLLEAVQDLISQDRLDEATCLFYAKALGRTPQEIEQMRADVDWQSRMAAAHTIPREMRAGGLDYRFAWSRLLHLETPTLLLMGEQSPPRLRASVAALHAVLPDSKVHTLPGHGHGGLSTAPDLVAAEVVDFVRHPIE